MKLQQRWFWLVLALLAVTLAQTPVYAYQGDARPTEREGASDPAFLPRLPDAVATDQMRRDFSEYKLPVAWDDEAGDWKTRTVDGRLTQTYYDHESRTKLLELANWYLASLKKHGFRIDFDYKLPDGSRRIVASLPRGGPVAFDLDLRPAASGPQLTLTMLDDGQDHRPQYDAQALADRLGQSARVRLRDVHFEPNGQVAPESALQLDEVGMLLKLDPKLRLHLEVATDEAGVPKRNRALSAKQASGVRNWLTKYHRIPAARLVPVGLGDVRAAGEGGPARWVELVRESAPVAVK
jgi:hypothetical protein